MPIITSYSSGTSAISSGGLPTTATTAVLPQYASSSTLTPMIYLVSLEFNDGATLDIMHRTSTSDPGWLLSALMAASSCGFLVLGLPEEQQATRLSDIKNVNVKRFSLP